MKQLKLLLVIIGIVVFANVPAASRDYALHQAVLDSDLTLVKRLLGKGAAIDVIGSRKYGYGSALHLAVREGHLDIVKLLLDRGAEVDVLDPDDLTPLHNAAWNGNLEMIKLLLDAGADIEASTYDGDTPLKLAQNNDQAQVAEFIQTKLQGTTTSDTPTKTTIVSDTGVVDISGTYTSTIIYKVPGSFIFTPNLNRHPKPEVSIKQQGGKITGTFTGDGSGTIEGYREGNTIYINFYSNVKGPGTGKWTIRDNANQIEGSFEATGSTPGSGTWNLTKIESDAAPIPDISGTYIASLSGDRLPLTKFVKSPNSKEIREVTIAQNGNQITATYDHGLGKMWGNIEGDRVSIDWYGHSNSGGKGELTIQPGGNEIIGESFTTGGWVGTFAWNLTKIEVEPAQLVDISGTYIANLSGDRLPLSRFVSKPYSKDVREITIVQSGNQITATYDHGIGKIWGDIEGDTVSIEWFGHNGNGGKGEWTIQPGGNELVGKRFTKAGWVGTFAYNLTKIKTEVDSIDVSGTYINTQLTYPSTIPRYFHSKFFGDGSNLKVTIKQSGNAITGVISGENTGEFKGVIKGREITIESSMNAEHNTLISGKGSWLVSDEGDTLTGSYRLHSTSFGNVMGSWTYGDLIGNWNFRKIEDEPAQVVDVSGTYTNTELTYPSGLARSWNRWYFGKGSDLNVTIEQSGNAITGMISGDSTGEIEGVITGNEIAFDFHITSAAGSVSTGDGSWIVSDDSGALNGTYKLNATSHGNLIGTWNFRKIESDVAKISKNFENDASPVLGIWNTRSQLSKGGHLDFPLNITEEFTAKYQASGSGEIFFDEMDGRGKLEGYWVENSGPSRYRCSTEKQGSRYWGLTVFNFSDDFKEFKGTWDHCGKGKKHFWNGKR